MRGAEAVIAARMAEVPLRRIDIDVLAGKPDARRRWQQPGLEILADAAVGRIEVYAADNPLTLDLRCCYGLPVLVTADSYDAGWPVAQKAIDCECALLNFAAADYAARYENGRIEAWEM